MPDFTLKCPECGTTLKTAKPVTPGKVITCPKCEVMFAAPKPAAPKPAAAPAKGAAPMVYDDVEIIDDIEIIGESTLRPEPEKSKKGSAPRTRRGRPKRQKMSGLMIGLLVGGILLGVAGLGVGGMLIWKYVINAPSDVLAYVPDDADVVVGIDLGRLMSDTQLGVVAERGVNSSPFNSYFRTTNTGPKQVFDRVIAAGNISSFAGAVTLLTKSPLEQDKLAQSMSAKAVTIGGRSAYEAPAFPGQPFLFNTAKSMTQFIGPRTKAEQLAPQIGKCKPSATMTAMINKASAGQIWAVIDLESPAVNMLKAFPGVREESKKELDETKCIAFWVKIANPEAQIVIQQQMKDSASMQKYLEAAKKEFEALKPKIDAAAKSGQIPLAFHPLIGDFVNSMEFSISGDCIVSKAKLKMGELEKALGETAQGMIPSPRGR